MPLLGGFEVRLSGSKRYTPRLENTLSYGFIRAPETVDMLRISDCPLPLFVVLCLVLGVSSCGDSPSSVTDSSGANSASTDYGTEEQLREAFASAVSGTEIIIPPGRHKMSRSLVMNASNITIRGSGSGRGETDSVLDFSDQVAGAEGMLLSGDDLTLKNFAIEDSIGDALKISGGTNITIRDIRTEWTNGPATENGAYGIYPVQTENLLVEDSIAIGASDAGIYVGQSRKIVVRNNIARHNVAGIEIENSIDADVYDNLTEDNTGGILVFNMPDIPMTGERTRVYENDVRNNNTENFAIPGTAVSGVPTGSGVMINSNDKVEVFNNRIGNNDTANIVIASYFSANFAGQLEIAPGFDPYPETLYIYDNSFTPGGAKPGRTELDALRVALYGADGRLPDVIWDGAVNPELPPVEQQTTDKRICMNNGSAILLNVDLLNGAQNPSTDMEAHNCELPKLAEVSFEEVDEH